MKAEGGDATLDCSRNSRASEKHPLDSVLTALHDSSKRKQLDSDSQPDPVPSVKRRRMIPEVRALLPLLLGASLHSRASGPALILGFEQRVSLKQHYIWPPLLEGIQLKYLPRVHDGKSSLHNITILSSLFCTAFRGARVC